MFITRLVDVNSYATAGSSDIASPASATTRISRAEPSILGEGPRPRHPTASSARATTTKTLIRTDAEVHARLVASIHGQCDAIGAWSPELALVRLEAEPGIVVPDFVREHLGRAQHL